MNYLITSPSITTSATSSPIITATSPSSPSQQQRRRVSTTKVKESFAAYAATEKALTSDVKYRKYTQLVDKTLATFGDVVEWADLISFLTKLIKCLQSYPQFQVIPHKLDVAKRLSQCLNPALPTGVHQRALDVYTHILNTIGPDNLRRDLPAWSSGLFPFFQYAATSIKPTVLGIYEKFYLPLQESLRPATKAFILALLPGLEEETGEFFEQVAALLDRISGTVSPSFFFQNLWLVLITAPNSRISALNYLSRRLPKMEGDDHLSNIGGQDVGLMVRGFAAALEDPQILVQRGILDLLTTTLKLNSAGFKSTRWEDKILLMRAIAGVVLRRDLSLSRRLYTWLLGPSDNSEAQVAHLQDHGLDLLHSALKADMVAQSVDPATRTRPFKIFVSLLDKWEIGGPLTEVLVLDAFAALQLSLRPNDDHDDLLMTANMLFEIIDPFLMWKQIYLAVRKDIKNSTAESISLARFIVHTFRLHDEEVQKLHAPFVAFGILDLVDIASRSILLEDRIIVLTAAIDFAGELLAEISPKFFESVDSGHSHHLHHLHHASSPMQESFGSTLADILYEASDMKTASLPETEGRELLASGFSTLLRLCKTTNSAPSCSPLLSSSLALVKLLSEATSHSGENLWVEWDPDAWTDSMLASLFSLSAIPKHFALHASLIKSIIVLSKTPTLRPAFVKNRRSVIEALSSKLLDYLQPACAPCFVESVQLIWGVQDLTTHRHIESMISDRLSSANTAIRLPAFEAFGNLWRFTEDVQLPGSILRNPMLLMLDSLKSDDLGTRRAGEGWMRCSLKSYLRILDPLIFTLLDPAIRQEESTIALAGIELPILVYRHTFDQALVHHILDDLLSLAKFGGQGFLRIAKGYYLKNTLDVKLRDRVAASQLDSHSHLEGVLIILVKFLRCEPTSELNRSIGPLNHHIHAVVADLLQIIVSRGEVDVASLRSVESAVTSSLFLSIHRNELDLQNKLLHLLHSVIFAIASQSKTLLSASGSTQVASTILDAASIESVVAAKDAMFVRVISDAISTQHNSAVIHHWIDFLLMTIPQFQRSLITIVYPLIDCLATRLRALVDEFKLTYDHGSSSTLPHPFSSETSTSIATEATDAEFVVLVNALERLVLVAASESRIVAAEEAPRSPEQRTAIDNATAMSGGGGGLLGYMSGVLGSAESGPAFLDHSKTRQLTLTRLREVVNLLLLVWDVTSSLESPALSNTQSLSTPNDESSSSQGYYTSRSKLRTRKAFERIYKSAPADALDNIVVYWDRLRLLGASRSQSRLFSILDLLAPNAEVVVTMLCDKLAIRNAAEKVARSTTFLIATDETTFAFLEAYINRMEGSSAVQVWSITLAFVKEFLANLTNSGRPFAFACLRCFTSLSEKISQTSALEDRRLRRDLQETLIRLTDAAILVAGRVVETTGWPNRSSLTLPSGTNGISSDSEKSQTSREEKLESSRSSLTPSPAHDITAFLSQRILPDLRRFLIDADKTITLCSNIVYYIAAPSLKTRSRTFNIEPIVFTLLAEMAKNPTTIKAWRTCVADALGDNRFFNARPSSHVNWKPLVQALTVSDKERLDDLIVKISTASNMFTNRETENLARTLSLRRLTYTIFCGEKNQYLTQLPAIQEKVVDLLRSNVDSVRTEVYLCLRVLLCRIGNQHLSGLWPVILTELLRLFEMLVDHAVPDGSDLLQLVLSACKFLDLTLVLQTDDFQIHQWMFVTDTVDAIYPPESWLPQAIMDRLGDALSDAHRSPTLFSSLSETPHDLAVLGAAPPLEQAARAEVTQTSFARHPLLTVRRIDTIAALGPFFSSVSLGAYESVYRSAGKVDWERVERGLEADLFEGQRV